MIGVLICAVGLVIVGAIFYYMAVVDDRVARNSEDDDR